MHGTRRLHDVTAQQVYGDRTCRCECALVMNTMITNTVNQVFWFLLHICMNGPDSIGTCKRCLGRAVARGTRYMRLCFIMDLIAELPCCIRAPVQGDARTLALPYINTCRCVDRKFFFTCPHADGLSKLSISCKDQAN